MKQTNKQNKFKVPFVGYKLQYKNIKEDLFKKWDKILSKGDLLFRDDLIQLEKNIADFVGCRYGISCDSCTGAMYLSLKALGIGPGDQVITVGHTYVATIDVIKHCGAEPILIDVDDNYNMNPELLENAITKKTKAIIPVHLNGRICDMEKIMQIAKKHKLKVIEDVAQSLGSSLNNKRAGSWGDTGCFSFHPAKILGSYGDGGMITTNNKELARKLYLIRDHGELPAYLEKEFGTGEHKKIYCWGYNSLLDNVQAAMLNVKFKNFSEFIKRRRDIAFNYTVGLIRLQDVKYLKLMKGPVTVFNNQFDVYQNYVIRTKNKKTRDELVKYLNEHGVETLISWVNPNHKQKDLGLNRLFDLPNTENISNTVISLPMYPELTDKQVKYVINTINNFFKLNVKREICKDLLVK